MATRPFPPRSRALFPPAYDEVRVEKCALRLGVVEVDPQRCSSSGEEPRMVELPDTERWEDGWEGRGPEPPVTARYGTGNVHCRPLPQDEEQTFWYICPSVGHSN